MNKIYKLFDYLLHNPRALMLAVLVRIAPVIPEKIYLKWLYYLQTGKKLDLNNPRTFSEKLQWLKLYDRKAEYTQMVDKYEAKRYVASIIGEEYIIPTLGVWDKFDDIDFDSLPNQFVLKTTHGGGNTGVVICKDQSTFDFVAAKKRLKCSLGTDIYRLLCEWPYKNVKKRIISEALMVQDRTPTNPTGDIIDYKFFCFNGEPKFCQVIAGRNDTMTVDFYNKDWQHQPFHEPKEYPFSEKGHNKPACLNEMWNLAKKLSAGHPFLRVDFYEINNKVKFGELTFFPTSGVGGFDPEEWDSIFGSWIELPIADINK